MSAPDKRYCPTCPGAPEMIPGKIKETTGLYPMWQDDAEPPLWQGQTANSPRPRAIPLQGFRCPQCNSVQLYAYRRDE